MGADDSLREIEFILDTGFVGYLALPLATVHALHLPFAHRSPIALADGTWVVVEVYRAIIEWENEEIDVEVLATGAEPLLGTSLLDGYDVGIQFTDGGLVTIESL